MARYYNAASINIEAATRSILDNGGGISERSNSDGRGAYVDYKGGW